MQEAAERAAGGRTAGKGSGVEVRETSSPAPEPAPPEASSWQDRLRTWWSGLSNPKRTGVAAAAAFVVVLMLGGAFALAGLAGGDDSTAALDTLQRVQVMASSSEAPLMLAPSSIELGAMERNGGTETMTWVALTPVASPIELGPDEVVLGEKETEAATFTDLRVRFEHAAAIVDGSYQELWLAKNTLWVRVPGSPEGQDPVLHLRFDSNASVVEDGEIFAFHPTVADAYWEISGGDGSGAGAGSDAEGGAANEADAASSAGAGAGGRGPGGSGGGGGGGSVGHAGGGGAGSSGSGAGSGFEQTSYHEGDDDGSDDSSGGDAGSGDGDGSENPPDPSQGRMAVYVRDAVDVVERLEVTFSRIAIRGSADAAMRTVFDGAAEVDLVQYSGDHDRALVGEFQIPESAYAAMYFQFSHAEATISGRDYILSLPQPVLVVEQAFDVRKEQRDELLFDFSVDESVQPDGKGGWEFRPVVGQSQSSAQDSDGDGVVDTADSDDDNDGVPDHVDFDRDGDRMPDQKPAQYRQGSSSMPTMTTSHSAWYSLSATDSAADRTETTYDAVTAGRPLGSKGSVSDPAATGDRVDAGITTSTSGDVADTSGVADTDTAVETESVGEAAAMAVSDALEPTGSTGERVESTVDAVTEAVDPVVDDVAETVDDLLP